MRKYVLIEIYKERQCKKCNEVKSLVLFRKDKRKHLGYTNVCKKCNNSSGKENRMKRYWINKEKENKESKNWYQNNREEKIKKSLQWNMDNHDKVKINKEKYKPTYNKCRVERRKTDVIYKLKDRISGLIRNSFQKTNFKKRSKSEEILGCTVIEFRLYIEAKFETWMTWHNHGIYNPDGARTWNLDHIRPVSLAKTEEELIALNHYTNFRPLCSLENILKGDKIIDVEAISE
jgi:hypothetical protein